MNRPPQPLNIAMFTPPSDLDPVVRATTYPYLIPDSSYLFAHGAWRPAEIGRALTAGRTPVLACGSNRSPEQLARKYADFGDAVIPVQRAWLQDFDVVYAAHLTGYGSVAANLQHVPGTRVEVSVTWLADDQMERMHATEGIGHDYHYARLHGLTLDVEGGETRREIFAYVYQKGLLRAGDGHEQAGLAEVNVEARPHPSLRQPEALALAQARIGHDGELAGFIAAVVADLDRRRRYEAVLQRDAVPFRWDKVDILV